MKRIIIIVFIIVISIQVNSQIRRGVSPFRFNQHMYLGANIGPNAFLADGFSRYGFDGSIGLSESVYIGYNLTELLGARVLGTFGSINWPGILSSDTPKHFSTMLMSFEALLNISNFFEVYNLKNPLDISIFAGAGVIAREKLTFDNEYIGLLLKGGINADYRLNYKYNINLSITGNIVNEKFNESDTGVPFDAFPEVKIGVTYSIRTGSIR